MEAVAAAGPSHGWRWPGTDPERYLRTVGPAAGLIILVGRQPDKSHKRIITKY
jgi:hypothetical protein